MKLLAIITGLFMAFAGAASAAMLPGVLSSGSPQGGGGGHAPVVTTNACNVALPVANTVNASLVGGGACTYTATCNSVACSGTDAITGWAVTTQSTANAFGITNAGILKGGSAAASVTAGSYTVTVTATNSTGTSTAKLQNVTVTDTTPVVTVQACTATLPVTNGVNVAPTCTYTATCASGSCISPYQITGWAITAQSVTNGFGITSAGVLRGGSNASSIIAGSPTVTLTATNAVGTSSGQIETVTVIASSSCPQGMTYADGCTGANVNSSVPYPTILASYGANRPPWNVAGVDYGVGIYKSVASLASPITLNGVSNFSCTGGGTPRCTWSGPGPYTANDIDWCQSGVGWQLIVNGAGLTLNDNNFCIGSSVQPMINAGGMGGHILTVKYSTFNGNNTTDGFNNGTWQLPSGSVSGGGITVTYSYIYAIPGDESDYGGTDVFTNNLWVSPGVAGSGGFHPDWVQLDYGTLNMTWNWNTQLQLNGASQGVGCLSQNTGGTIAIATCTVQNNTIVTAVTACCSGQPNYPFGIQFNGPITGGSSGGLGTTGVALFQNNYIDPTGINAELIREVGSLQAGATFTSSGNINMLTGGACNSTAGTGTSACGP